MIRRTLPALLLLGALTCCASPEVQSGNPDAAPIVAPVDEQSVNPNINKKYKAIEGEEDLKEWINRFESEDREIFDQRDEIVACVGLKPGQVVADIGAGTGLLARLFANQVGTGGQVYAVDIVPAFLELIQRLSAQDGITHLKTVLCTDKSVELPAASVDVAFICDVYHHFEFPLSSMTSLHSAVRPGGTLVVVDFKRIEGVSSDWIMGHVRAGQEVFRAEIEQSGFEFVEEYDILQQNYVMKFRRMP